MEPEDWGDSPRKRSPHGTTLDAGFPSPLQNYRTVNRTYYAGGLLATETDPLGAVTTYEYDNGARNKGYLTSVTLPPLNPGGAGRTISYTRNTDGTVSQMTDATSKVTTYEYDPLGRLKKTNYGVNGSPLFSEQVTYDANGNVTSRTDGNGRVTSYVYDEKRPLGLLRELYAWGDRS